MGDIQGEHGHRPSAMDNPVGGMRVYINIEFCSGRDVSPSKKPPPMKTISFTFGRTSGALEKAMPMLVEEQKGRESQSRHLPPEGFR